MGRGSKPTVANPREVKNQMVETLQGWKEDQGLSDEQILTTKYLDRVSIQPPAPGNEIVYCACGCGKYWLRPLDQDKKRRFVRGHSPRTRARRRYWIEQGYPSGRYEEPWVKSRRKA